MSTPARFTLNEDAAREWLARAIAAYEGTEAEAPDDAFLPQIGKDYRAQDFDYHSATGELVANAWYAEILTGPCEINWDFVTDGEGEAGYVWLLYIGESDGRGHHKLKLASLYEDLRHVGDREAANGADAALAVLREAVQAGNALVDDLAAYVASVAADSPDGSTQEPCGDCGAPARQPCEIWCIADQGTAR